MSTRFRQYIVSVAILIISVSGLMLLLGDINTERLPDTGDRVMIVLASPSGTYEWDGPFEVLGREDGMLVVMVHGKRTLVDFPQAISLEDYRRTHEPI